MRKSPLTDLQMSAVEYVERAAWWSKELTRFRARGPGDTENAMRSLERDYGLDYWFLWRLRYRRPQIKDVGVSLYARLEAAYCAECERQQRKLTHELEVTQALVGPNHPAVVAAALVVGEAETKQGDAADLSAESGNREA